MARPIYGEPQPATQFQYESSFGKTLYAWRIQITPSDVAELRKQADRERLLGVLLVPVSLVIIAVGLGVLWLSVRAERRGVAAAQRLHRQRVARAQDAAVADPHVRRAAGDRASTRARRWAREYAGIITREAERLSHLIDNVLDFARLERGKASYHFAEGHLEEVVERALDVFRHRLEKEKLRLRTEIESNLPAVRMDEGAMTLVLLNLVDNAVKYAGDGGEVSVRLRRVPGRGGAVDRRPRRRASRPTSSGGSSSASTAPRTRARATCAAAASGWRWSSTSRRRTAAASRSRARRGGARRSPSTCRSRRS